MMMFQIIKKAEIKFPSQITISNDAKDLIKKVLLHYLKVLNLIRMAICFTIYYQK